MEDSLLYTPTEALEVGDLIRRAHHQLMDAEETLDSIKRYIDKTVFLPDIGNGSQWFRLFTGYQSSRGNNEGSALQALEGILADIEELTDPSHDEDVNPLDCHCLDCFVGILESWEEYGHE